MAHPIPRLRLLPGPVALDYVETSLAEQHQVNNRIGTGLQEIRDELQKMNGKLEGLEGIRKRWDRVFQVLLCAAALAACGAVAQSWAASQAARNPPPQTERPTR